jgi:hypothetical protein
MSPSPPRYPRIPHIIGGRGTPDDDVLDEAARRRLLRHEIIVEEKLDGANVSLWQENGLTQVTTRGGPEAMDRAGQLGRLKAWLGEHHAAVGSLLEGGLVAYGEWLLLTHTVTYDHLPGYLVVLDLLEPDGNWARPDDRNKCCAEAGLPVPPPIWRGVPQGGIAELERLASLSAFGQESAEGIVVRTVDGSAPRASKLLRHGFSPIGDAEWSSGRPQNRLAPEAV